jgi:hypothetical protein
MSLNSRSIEIDDLLSDCWWKGSDVSFWINAFEIKIQILQWSSDLMRKTNEFMWDDVRSYIETNKDVQKDDRTCEFVDGDDEMMRLIEWNLPLIWPFTNDDVMWWDLNCETDRRRLFWCWGKERNQMLERLKKKKTRFLSGVKWSKLSDYQITRWERQRRTPNIEIKST